MIFVEPEECIGNEEITDFFSAIIIDKCSPFGVASFSGVIMFIECCSVKSSKTMFILGEMGWDPVQDNTNIFLMTGYLQKT